MTRTGAFSSGGQEAGCQVQGGVGVGVARAKGRTVRTATIPITANATSTNVPDKIFIICSVWLYGGQLSSLKFETGEQRVHYCPQELHLEVSYWETDRKRFDQADRQSLRIRMFFLWNFDARENVKLLDANFVRERMRFVGHWARLTQRK